MPAVFRRASVGLVSAMCLVAAVAVAQGRKPTKTKPPPTTATDAGAAESADASALSVDAGAASTTPGLADAGPVPPPPMLHGEMGDGGVRASPLNPAPNEFAQPVDAGAPSIDYDKLIADIASLRARVAAVGDNLFHSRIAIQIRTDGDHGKIGRLVVSLDDGALYPAP